MQKLKPTRRSAVGAAIATVIIAAAAIVGTRGVQNASWTAYNGIAFRDDYYTNGQGVPAEQTLGHYDLAWDEVSTGENAYDFSKFETYLKTQESLTYTSWEKTNYSPRPVWVTIFPFWMQGSGGRGDCDIRVPSWLQSAAPNLSWVDGGVTRYAPNINDADFVTAYNNTIQAFSDWLNSNSYRSRIAGIIIAGGWNNENEASAANWGCGDAIAYPTAAPAPVAVKTPILKSNYFTFITGAMDKAHTVFSDKPVFLLSATHSWDDQRCKVFATAVAYSNKNVGFGFNGMMQDIPAYYTNGKAAGQPTPTSNKCGPFDVMDKYMDQIPVKWEPAYDPQNGNYLPGSAGVPLASGVDQRQYWSWLLSLAFHADFWDLQSYWLCDDDFESNPSNLCKNSIFSRITSDYAFPIDFGSWVRQQAGQSASTATQVWTAFHKTEYPLNNTGFLGYNALGWNKGFERDLNHFLSVKSSASVTRFCNVYGMPSCSDTDKMKADSIYGRHAARLNDTSTTFEISSTLGLIGSTVTNVPIRIAYYDNSTDDFSFSYLDGSSVVQTVTVDRQNLGTWRWATTTASTLKVGNHATLGTGILKIAYTSGVTAPIIHMVMVDLSSTGVATPTPTPTPTQHPAVLPTNTPTPTPKPLDAPNVRRQVVAGEDDVVDQRRLITPTPNATALHLYHRQDCFFEFLTDATGSSLSNNNFNCIVQNNATPALNDRASGILFRQIETPKNSIVISSSIQTYCFSCYSLGKATIYIRPITKNELYPYKAMFPTPEVQGSGVVWDMSPDNAKNGWLTSPDIGPIIQEAINDANWVQGMDLGIYIVPYIPPSGTPFAYSYFARQESHPTQAPILNINYSAGPTATPTPTPTQEVVATPTPAIVSITEYYPKGIDTQGYYDWYPDSVANWKDGFVELRNNSSVTATLNGWELQITTGAVTTTHTFTASVPPLREYVIYSGDVATPFPQTGTIKFYRPIPSETPQVFVATVAATGYVTQSVQLCSGVWNKQSPPNPGLPCNAYTVVPTPTRFQTATSTPAATSTPTWTPTVTRTPTVTPTVTNTPTVTSTPTRTPTPSPTKTNTPTFAPTSTPTSASGTSVAYQVSASNNDADQQETGTLYLNGCAVNTGSDYVCVTSSNSSIATTRYWGGLRFTNITIPKRSLIISANLEVYVESDSLDDPNTDIYYETTNDSIAFSSGYDVDDRPLSSVKVTWANTGIGSGWKTSPDITTLIQEIVDRTGWVSGNDLSLILKSRTDLSTRTLGFKSYDQNTSLAAKLNIVYGATRGVPRQDQIPMGNWFQNGITAVRGVE